VLLTVPSGPEERLLCGAHQEEDPHEEKAYI